MKRISPPLPELLAIDALYRNGNLSSAAAELCVTVGAVSKQMASLEKFVEQRLTQRDGRNATLTVAGASYARRVGPLLREIEAATIDLRSHELSAGVLNVSSVPTFLTKWLIPRLPSFRTSSPNVTLSFCQHLGGREPLPANVDIAIRYGPKRWSDAESEYLAGQEFVVVHSPALSSIESFLRGELTSPHTLLHHEQDDRAWLDWAGTHRVPFERVQGGPRFAQYSSMIQAAVSGLGACCVPKILVVDEIASNQLVQAMKPITRPEQGHFLCYDRSRVQGAAFCAFRDWLFEQVNATKL
jgi:LysR family transcriptional regulator, glycine cleavage system transcriptional activator